MVFPDIALRNPAWKKLYDILVDDKNEDDGILKKHRIFRRNVDLFVICFAIGVYFDKRTENLPSSEIATTSMPRNTVNNTQINKTIEFIYLNAILNTTYINYDDDIRLRIAFAEEDEAKKYITGISNFISGFANYGAEYLYNFVGDNLYNLEMIALNMKEKLFREMLAEDDIDLIED